MSNEANSIIMNMGAAEGILPGGAQHSEERQHRKERLAAGSAPCSASLVLDEGGGRAYHRARPGASGSFLG